MSDVRVNLDVQYHIRMDRSDGLSNDCARFRKAAIWVATRFEFERFTASVSIVDDPTIHELNRVHLDHDWPTDVISFSFERDDTGVDGEIIASSDTAAREYNHAGWSHADEILLYVVHGMLHLAGLDDLDDVDRRKMRLVEQECLMALNVPGAEEHLSRWDKLA